MERIGLGSCIPAVPTANVKPHGPEASRDELTPKASLHRRGNCVWLSWEVNQL